MKLALSSQKSTEIIQKEDLKLSLRSAKKLESLTMQQSTTVQSKKPKLTLADFEEAFLPDTQTSALGKGSYGVVKLVKQKDNPNGPLYAMKIVNF